MRRGFFGVTLLVVVTALSPAHAVDAVLTIRNAAQTPVTSVSVYPLRADGSIVDDVIAGSLDPIAPGATGSVKIYGGCRKVMVRVMLDNVTELRSNLDLCRQRALVVRS